MKVVFISNKITPHQVPFCIEMHRLCQGDFLFIETLETNEELPIGWKTEGNNYPFVINTDILAENFKSIYKNIMNADAVIIGSAPDSLIIERIKARKLTLKYSERLYKKRLTVRNFFHAAIGSWIHHGRFQKYPMYMLCSSAYTALDCAVFHNYLGKTFKWGYFPEVKNYDNIENLIELKHPASILWVGRFIGWKHPELAIHAVEQLRNEGYDLQLDIIGTGVLDGALEEMVKSKSLGKNVHFLGAMPPEEVRKHMEKAQIFLFTSDRNEGWGAVLNEAMNSGCAVVASHAIGSVPFLIKNGENGLVFKDGDLNDLKNKVKRLLDHPDECARLGRAAYDTMVTQWNAENAAKRLIKLCENILAGGNGRDVFTDGVCSEAKVISDLYNGEKNV